MSVFVHVYKLAICIQTNTHSLVTLLFTPVQSNAVQQSSCVSVCNDVAVLFIHTACPAEMI